MAVSISASPSVSHAVHFNLGRSVSLPAHPQITLQAEDGRFLGADGWQGKPAMIDTVIASGRHTILQAILPFAANVPPKTAMTLDIPAAEYREALVWPDRLMRTGDQPAEQTSVPNENYAHGRVFHSRPVAPLMSGGALGAMLFLAAASLAYGGYWYFENAEVTRQLVAVGSDQQRLKSAQAALETEKRDWEARRVTQQRNLELGQAILTRDRNELEAGRRSLAEDRRAFDAAKSSSSVSDLRTPGAAAPIAQSVNPVGNTADNQAILWRCDTAAANPTDSRKPSFIRGVAFKDIRLDEAIAACEAATRVTSDPRYSYQLARAYQSTQPDKAVPILVRLAGIGYPAVYDNLGQISLSKGETRTADNHFRTGAGMGDTGSMLSLAFLIAENKPPHRFWPAEAAFWLRRAASTGNPVALRLELLLH